MSTTKTTTTRKAPAKATATKKPAAKPAAAPKAPAKPVADRTPKAPGIARSGRVKQTDAEREVMVKDLLAQGLNNAQIKAAMRAQNIAVSTFTLNPLLERLCGTRTPNAGARKTKEATVDTGVSLDTMKAAAEVLKKAGRYSGEGKIVVTKANAEEIIAATPTALKAMPATEVPTPAQPDVNPIPKPTSRKSASRSRTAA